LHLRERLADVGGERRGLLGQDLGGGLRGLRGVLARLGLDLLDAIVPGDGLRLDRLQRGLLVRREAQATVVAERLGQLVEAILGATDVRLDLLRIFGEYG